MKTIYKKIISVVVASATFSLNAQAGSIGCGGNIDMLVIHQPGLVGIKLSSMNTYVFVCSLDVTVTPAGAGSIQPSTCKAIYAALLGAKLQNKSINDLIFDGDGVPASCDTWPGFSQVFLRFLPLA